MERVTMVVKGDYRYGPNISEQEACNVAAQRAKEDALRQVFGEMISVDEQFSCREKSGRIENRDCAYDKSTWSMIDGEIGSAVQQNQVIFNEDGAKRCWVELKVDVFKPTKRPDFDLDLKVTLANSLFKTGDNLSFEVAPSKSGYLAVFSWTPNSGDRSLVTKIFPNVIEPVGLINVRRKIPGTSPSAVNYEFKLKFEDAKKDFVDEYLIFILTSRKINWMEEYNYDDFRSRLREIPGDEKRTVKRAYRIVR
jgi:hypothetical protein